MDEIRWNRFKEAALGRGRDIVVALIVDSPWIPGHCGISHFDYFLFPERWFEANLRIYSSYPDIVFLPGFWVEYGMATEPSAFGCRITWWENNTPSVSPVIHNMADLDRLRVPKPEADGLMPFVLHWYRWAQGLLMERNMSIKMVAARGPLALAAHLRGMTEFLTDLKIEPAGVKRLLEITTSTVIEWLKAQAETLGTVEGIMVLDDIVGFLSRQDYIEFAHPYLREIFDSFPDMVKVYHNDANIRPFMDKLAETGLDVLNFGYNLGIDELARVVGEKICIMGNIPPLSVLAQGRPEDVKHVAAKCLESVSNVGIRRFILSAGGGVSPGTPQENISAIACSGSL
ncbi:MAG TPA: uroporphyrinogen decarboxylase [Firmicutes bacterium]|nr:uroporphyrinogen decarboxylase [Bacillota bacterium]